MRDHVSFPFRVGVIGPGSIEPVRIKVSFFYPRSLINEISDSFIRGSTTGISSFMVYYSFLLIFS